MTVRIVEVGKLDHTKIVDLDLGGDEMRQGALAGLCAEWAKREPFYVINNGIPQAVIARYADCMAAFMDKEHFTSRPPHLPGYERFDFFNGMISVAQTDSPDHDRIRRVLNPLFAPSALKKVDEAIQQIVTTMLDEVEAKDGPFDCINDFAGGLVVRIVLDGLLGLNERQIAAFIRMNKAFALIVDLAPGATPPQQYLDAQAEVGEVMVELIAERREIPREHDFVSSLVQVIDTTGAISYDEAVVNIFAILAAGQSTTAISTAAMLMNLCKRRDQFDEVIANPVLIPQVVEESLRFQNSGFFAFPRFVTSEFDLGGTRLYPGMPVHICTLAANLDPERFQDPLTFDIHRNPRGIMTFGTGPHHCLGNRLGRRVLQVVLEQVCQRFPKLHLIDPDFVPEYEGMFSELRPATMPMSTGK
jgi:cytochrome P450